MEAPAPFRPVIKRKTRGDLPCGRANRHRRVGRSDCRSEWFSSWQQCNTPRPHSLLSFCSASWTTPEPRQEQRQAHDFDSTAFSIIAQFDCFRKLLRLLSGKCMFGDPVDNQRISCCTIGCCGIEIGSQGSWIRSVPVAVRRRASLVLDSMRKFYDAKIGRDRAREIKNRFRRKKLSANLATRHHVQLNNAS